jgi:hypothetical protein
MVEQGIGFAGWVWAHRAEMGVWAIGLLALCYVLAFLGWCLWHFVEDVVDERQARQDVDLHALERHAYKEHRSGQKGAA